MRRKLNFVISCFAGAEKQLELLTGAENPARLFIKKIKKYKKKEKNKKVRKFHFVDVKRQIICFI